MTNTLTRRQVISGALALSGAAPAIGQARHKRPNILFAIADDQSYCHTSARDTRLFQHRLSIE